MTTNETDILAPAAVQPISNKQGLFPIHALLHGMAGADRCHHCNAASRGCNHPFLSTTGLSSQPEALNLAYACNNATRFSVLFTMKVRQQLLQHSVAFIGLTVALSSLAYNRWRTDN